MNSRSRRFLSIFLPGLLCLIFAGSLRAQTTFTYTGNPYPPSGCNAAPVCNGTVPFLYVKFTTSLSLSQLSSLPGYSTGSINLTPYVTSWTVTDGDLLSITQASSGAGFAVSLSMPSGTPVNWLVSAQGNSANGSDHDFACTTTVGNASYGGFPYCNGVLTGDFSQVSYNYPYSGVIYSSGIIYNYPNNGARGTWTVTQPDVNVNANETITTIDSPIIVAMPQLVDDAAPVAYFSAGSLGFEGESGTLPITVSNIGGGNLSIPNTIIQGGAFSISQVACTAGATQGNIPSAASCVFSVTYTAPTSGAATGTFTLYDNAALSNLPSTGSGSSFTQSVPLSGTGSSTEPPTVPPVNVYASVNEAITVVDTPFVAATPPLAANNAPVAYFSVGGLDFGGQSGTKAVAVSNIGQQSLSLAAVSSPASPFSISQIACSNGLSALPATLASGASCILSISYVAPSSGSPAGTITFTDNADLSNLASAASGANFTQSLSLSGSGTSAPPPPPDTNLSVGVNETITVVDTVSMSVEYTTPPVVTVPANITVSATSASGAVVTFSASATDLGDGTDPVTCTPPSGSTFPIGTTTVSCSATDKAGYTGSATFSVTVQDTTPPVVTVPANITISATSASGAVATFSASATDLVDGTDPVTCTPPSGSTFPIATTPVSCSATDKAGNTTTNSFTVAVKDTTPPVLTLPGNLTATATSAAGAVVTFSATATDLVDGTDPVTCTPPSGSTFPIATTTVSCSATDKAGNMSTGTFTVTVQSPTVPKITWSTPAAITYGKALSATQLDATSTVAGTFVYTPAAGTVLGAGLRTLSVTFTPANPALYSSATVTVSLLVNPAPLTVKAENVRMKYGAALPDFAFRATGFVNGDTAATALTGAPTLTTTATSQSPVGSYTITASAGTLAAANYTFTFKTGTLTIEQATLTAAATDASTVYGSPIPTPAYTLSGFVNGDSQATAVTGSPSLSNTATTASTVGSYAIDISTGTLTSTNYKFAFKNGTLTITKATPSINWTTPAPIAYGTPLSAAQLDASPSVGGSFVYSPVAGTVLDVATHILTATFTPADTTDYTTAKATVSLTVNQAAQTISFTRISSPVVYGVAPISLSATSSSGLAVKFSVLSGPAKVSASTLTITGAGTVIVAADQAGNSDYAAAPEITQTVMVNKATPVIALASSASSIAISKAVTFTATLTGSGVNPTGTVTFLDGTTVIGTGTVDGSGVAKYATTSLTLGPQSITASYGGDSNYVAASSAAVSVTITPK